MTAQRYADIVDDSPRAQARASSAPAATPAPRTRPAAQQQAQQAPVPAAGASRAGATSAAAFGHDSMSVEEEVRHLKRMIAEMKNAQDEMGHTSSGAQALMPNGAFAYPALQDAYEQLVLNGIDKRFALALIKKVAFELTDSAKTHDAVIDSLAAEIMNSTETLSTLSGIKPREKDPTRNAPAVIAVVGPTGVGKTTTVAKMASEALLRRNLKVGLINLDCYKVAAFDQLATYAKILSVPFRSAKSVEDLAAALADFQSLDLVIIDTTGRSQRDPGSLKEMDSMIRSIEGIRTQLVLSATTRDNELYDMANRFALFRPQGIIMSKLDEASIYGSLYNVSQKVSLPLLYFTTGQRVPEDIEEATKERVAALIMDL
jgi:flagellar biosynthesis GTPase FlhF